MNKQGKRRAESAGRRAEVWAALALQLKGYAILERRFKTKLGEIDLIARRGKAVIFIEVKHRKSYEAALHSVTGFQTNRISAAAELYMAQQRTMHDFEWRFDIIVTGSSLWPRHIKDAWRD